MAFLKHSITLDAATRALNAPYDNAQVDKLHGVDVHDAFRPLENYTDPAVVAWAGRETAAFDDYLKPATAAFNEAVAFLKDTIPTVMRESMPSRYGQIYAVWRKQPGDERRSAAISFMSVRNCPSSRRGL